MFYLFNLVTSNNLINYHVKSKLKENRKSKSEWDLHDSSSESDSISLVVTNRNLNTQQSQYFDALDTIEENEEESTDDDLSDLDVSFCYWYTLLIAFKVSCLFMLLFFGCAQAVHRDSHKPVIVVAIVLLMCCCL